MAKSKKEANPMDSYRKQQKKKEAQKQKKDKEKRKFDDLLQKDTQEIKEELTILNEQERSGKLDNRGKKRKVDLKKALEKSEQEAQQPQMRNKNAATQNKPLSLKQLEKANKKKYANPENSVYYHPIMNPYGAPPPGMPQRYKNEINPTTAHSIPPPPRGPPPPPRGPPPSAPPGPPRGPPPGPPPGHSKAYSRKRGALPLQNRVICPPPLPKGPPPQVVNRRARNPPLPVGRTPVEDTIKDEETDADDDLLRKRLLAMKRDMDLAAQSSTEKNEMDEEIDDDVQSRIMALKQGIPPPPPRPEEVADMQIDDSDEEEEKERKAYADAQLRGMVPTALRVRQHAETRPKPSVRRVPRPVPQPSSIKPLVPDTNHSLPTQSDLEYQQFMAEMKSLNS